MTPAELCRHGRVVAVASLLWGVGAALASAAGTSGAYLVEGDIFTDTPPDPGAPIRRAIGVRGTARLWPNGEVPYRHDARLDRAGIEAVREAVARWNALAGITLRLIEDDEPPPRDHLVFEPGSGCASWVGRQGGAQSVWVGSACTSGSVMHEIGHALGLEHEHTRADRDQYVRINWGSITPAKRHNFDTAPPDSRLLGAYDLDSIMHYGRWNFSIDGRATIEPIDPLAGARMGQRDGPSAGDIAAIARLYASDLSLVVQLDDERAVREMALFVTNEHEQGAHDLRLELTAPGLRSPEWSDGWTCTTGASRARCSLARLPGGASTTLRFGVERALDPRVLHAVLDAKTPDIDRSDNGGAVRSYTAPELASAYGEVLADSASGAEPDASDGGGGSLGWAGWLVLLTGSLIARSRPVVRLLAVRIGH